MTRINKFTAKKMYRNGRTIYLMACKVRLGNAWIQPFPINISDAGLSIDDTFEKGSPTSSITTATTNWAGTPTITPPIPHPIIVIKWR